MADYLKYLSPFSSEWIKTMTKITYNGYMWHIKNIDKRSENQNSGVLVNSCIDVGGIAYYGVLIEIIQLSYPQERSVILF